MWYKISGILLRNRFSILGIITLLTVFFGYYAVTGLKLENKYGIVLPKNSPTTQNYNYFKSMFGEDGGTLVIAIQSDSLYTNENFLKWKELGDSLLQVEGVLNVVSEATLFSIKNNIDGQKFEINKIFSDVTYQEKSIKEIEKEIKSNPIYKQILYNDTANVSLMMIGMDEKFLADQKKSHFVLEAEEIALGYEKYFGKMHFAGLPHLRVILAKRIQGEMYFFIALSILVTSILLYIFFRSFRVVFICNLVVIVGVIWAIGLMGFLGYRLSILMALIPPLVIVIGVPNCIFLMTKYHQEVKYHGNKIKALSRVIQKIGTATFLTNFTTAIGFLTFAFTNSEKLMEFGISASLNIMMVFVLSICLLPIFATFQKTPKERHLKHLDRKFASGLIRLVLYLTQYQRKWILIVTIAIVTVSAIGLVQIKATGNITGDLPKTDKISKDVKFIERYFGGAIPFEIMLNYKEQGRIFKRSTLEKIEEIQTLIQEDTLFSRSISIVDFVKAINMAYYGGDTNQYKIIANRDKVRLKKYMDNFDLTNPNGGSFSLTELIDTTNTTARIRCQMKDLGSYEVAQKVTLLKEKIDSILNPDKKQLENYFAQVKKGKKDYLDSLIYNHSDVYNSLTALIAKGNSDLQYRFDSDPELIKSYMNHKDFNQHLRSAIDANYFDLTFTGTSVVASEGTRYLVNNLFSSLLFAIVCISLLMALLFRSWRMVLISMVPNFIPLIVTAGIMGWFGIPLKPSTLLVFSIALGISVDDTIHYLSKYRQELKSKKFTLKECVLISIRESGLGMFYTSIVLFCGFSVFMFSQFGGTQALGLLISITLLTAMVTNLIILPSLLLFFERKLTTKEFEEPYFEAYEEDSDIDWTQLELSTDEDLDDITDLPRNKKD